MGVVGRGGGLGDERVGAARRICWYLVASTGRSDAICSSPRARFAIAQKCDQGVWGNTVRAWVGLARGGFEPSRRNETLCRSAGQQEHKMGSTSKANTTTTTTTATTMKTTTTTTHRSDDDDDDDNNNGGSSAGSYEEQLFFAFFGCSIRILMRSPCVLNFKCLHRCGFHFNGVLL